jgi:hypothetical protein
MGADVPGLVELEYRCEPVPAHANDGTAQCGILSTRRRAAPGSDATCQSVGLLGRLRSAVRPTTWPHRDDVDHPDLVAPPEDDSPLTDTEPPEALLAPQTLHVTSRQTLDCPRDPIPRSAIYLPQRLERRRADLDPPLARITQS